MVVVLVLVMVDFSKMGQAPFETVRDPYLPLHLQSINEPLTFNCSQILHSVNGTKI